MIHMEDRYPGVHNGRFGLAEWEIHGYSAPGMVLRYSRTWPHCANMERCFTFVDLAETQRKCLSEPLCDGFSFSAASINGGRGGGCYKTSCLDDGNVSFGRG